MAGVNGKGYLVQIDITAIATTIGAQTSMSLNWTSSPIEVTTKDDNDHSTFIPGPRTWTIDLDGKIVVADTAQLQVLAELTANTEATFTIVRPEDSDLWEGQGIVTAWNYEAAQGGSADFSCSIQGSGLPAKIWVP
jgi:predicted secreted protein